MHIHSYFQSLNIFKKILLSVFIFLIYFVNISAQSYEAIGTVNPSDYEPAQKNIAQGKNGMVTTQHFF